MVVSDLHGTNGDDVLFGGDVPGDAIFNVFGLAGNDTIYGGLYVDSGAGDDIVYTAGFDSTIFTGSGNDTVIDYYETAIVDTGAGDDAFYFSYTAFFGSDHDQVDLGAGNDFGSTYILPNYGDGTRTLKGGDGIDTLSIDGRSSGLGWSDIDFVLLAGSGSFKISGVRVESFERVIFYDTQRFHNINFNNLDDYYVGTGSDKTVHGNGGNDYIDSSGQGDHLYGDSGDDVIVVDGGTNLNPHEAYGGDGDDLIVAHHKSANFNATNLLYGGAGSDGFVTNSPRISHSKIMDFDETQDWIGIGEFGYSGYDLLVTQGLEVSKFNVVDTADILSFDYEYQNSNTMSVVHIEYDRNTGDLFITTPDTSTSGNKEFTLEGAPNLTPDHFYTMTEQNGFTSNDLLHGNNADNHLYGLGGNDQMYGLAGDDILEGHDGNDILDGGDGNDTLYSDAGDDILYGRNGQDKLIAGGGNDFANGGAGDDKIYGANGNDRLKGEDGNDLLKGGNGDDILKGGDGDDSLYGEAGNDILIAGNGLDKLFGGNDDDFLFGGRDNDDLDGGFGHDKLRGNLGSDILKGQAGNDDLRGGGQNDVLFGQEGNDFLLGENGNDQIDGGIGNDTMVGGVGIDTYWYRNTGYGFDRIKDWEDNSDIINLTDFGFANFNTDVFSLASDTSAGLRINFGGGNVLFIEDFVLADFDASDVIF